MQNLRQSEINMFIEMIKTSIDGSGKNRIIKSRNSPLQFSIAYNQIAKKRSQTNRSQSCIVNQLSFEKDKDIQVIKGKSREKREKSFYELYNEDVIKRFKDQKIRNKSNMRISRYRPASISEVNNIKLKSFEFDPMLPEQQIAKCFRSDQFSPIRKQKSRKKQAQKQKQRRKQRSLEKSFQHPQQKDKQQRYSKICSPKSGTDWVEGKKKQLSMRFQFINMTKNQQEQQSEPEQYQFQPFTKLKLKYPKHRLSVAKTPQPIKSNTSYIHLNFKKKQEIQIDPWITNDDY